MKYTNDINPILMFNEIMPQRLADPSVWVPVAKKHLKRSGPARGLAGKVAVITGSSRGIGRTIAGSLGNAGVKVVLNGRNKVTLERTLDQFLDAGCQVSAFCADVSDYHACLEMLDHAVSRFGHIDILVNNAGCGSRGFIEETSPEVFRMLFRTNVLGSVFPTLAAIPYLKRSHGSIVFVSSLAALRGMPNLGPYAMTKMAQTACAESLRIELHQEGIHVGIVYAGKTINDPEKTVLSADGSFHRVLAGKPLLTLPQERVARAVLNNIKHRRFKTTVGLRGRFYFLVQKFAPWLLDSIFRHELDWIKHDKA